MDQLAYLEEIKTTHLQNLLCKQNNFICLSQSLPKSSFHQPKLAI